MQHVMFVRAFGHHFEMQTIDVILHFDVTVVWNGLRGGSHVALHRKLAAEWC